jgi:hypothetical protein
MSVRQLMVTNTADPDYGKISPSYIPTSLKPVGNDTTLGVYFTDNTDDYTIVTGNKIFKFVTIQEDVSNKFNFEATKMTASVSANIFFDSNVETTTNFIQSVPQKVYFRLFNNADPAVESNYFYINPVQAVNGATGVNGTIRWSFSLNDVVLPVWNSGLDTITIEFIIEFDTAIIGAIPAPNTNCDASLILTPCL